MSSDRSCHLTSSVVLFVLCAGCSQGVPRAEVIGAVTLNGDPVLDAQVYLSPKSGAAKPQGTYSAAVVAGTFEFIGEQGPPPGDYEIFVQPLEEEEAEDVFERVKEGKRKALFSRDQLLSAIARQGTIQIELLADEVHEVSIELTTR